MKQTSLEFKFKALLADNNASSYVLAVSAGVDSMVSLDLFTKFCDKPFRVAYFDHQIRENTDFDISLIKTYCSKNGLEFELGRADIPIIKGNLEANARKCRYEFLNSVNQKDGLIVTAHHSDDQVETVFMNFLKGSFVSGLAGLARIDYNRNLWRPLLSFTKNEILEYAAKNKIKFVEDSTNSDPKYLRNFLRLKVLPQLNEKIGSLQAVARNADFYSELDDYLDQNVELFLSNNFRDNKVERVVVMEQPSFLRFKIYQKLAGNYELSIADFKEIDELVRNGVSKKFRQLGEVRFCIDKKKLFVEKIIFKNL